jgi:hypothetical protein
MDLGEDTAKHDFQWLFTAIATEMLRIYRDNPRWRSTILDQDNVTFPIMAALGRARELYPEHIEEHQNDLLSRLQASASDSDHLQLSEPEGKSLEWVLSGVRPNIMGRFCRNMVFDAMLDYFQRGVISDTTVIDWLAAQKRNLKQ